MLDSYFFHYQSESAVSFFNLSSNQVVALDSKVLV